MTPHTDEANFKRIPCATYRLQFNRNFTLREATELLEYLCALGITDIYASPLFQAGPDSTHGYDVCCFDRLNPALGTDGEFEIFSRRRQELGLGLLLDMVPNHMGAVLSNGWWLDVLENGPASRYADFFDINWKPSNPSLQNKILLPVLETHYGEVLDKGELKLMFSEGKFFVAYGARQFPVCTRSLPEEFQKPAAYGEAGKNLSDSAKSLLERFNGRPGEPRSFDALHDLLQQQHYRLAHWRVGPEEINYRRFFDVTDLVSLRMELPVVFEAVHEVVFGWLKSGKVTGLRIDHPDGLRDPKDYFDRLQSKAAEFAGSDVGKTAPLIDRTEPCASPAQCLQPARTLYIVAEKILSGDERLPDDWAVDGTTGYDFLNRVNGLFVNRANEAAMDRAYREFLGQDVEPAAFDFRKLVHQSKTRILESSLISELEALTHRLHRLSSETRAGADFTFRQLRAALKEVIAAFPVYRTYATSHALELSSQDRAAIQRAFAEVRRLQPQVDPMLVGFLEKLLMLELLPELNPDETSQAREFILRFQQLTGPVMAKGLEDTAFYRFNRLISLNEVGGAPDPFDVSLEEFHNTNCTIAARWPHTLLATATHDTKRGEDLRARINVLSEMPDEWEQAVRRWREWNAGHRTLLSGVPAPSPDDEYLIYQSLVGALPHDANEPASLNTFRERLAGFLRKAVREAKVHTHWTDPNTAYEQALDDFAKRILTATPGNRFPADLRSFSRRVAFFGKLNSLGQTLLKITSPGVPDFYQGTELWDLSFVDPDNRCPVDFNLRREMLTGLRQRLFHVTPFTAQDLASDHLGRIKMFVIWKALELRNRRRQFFECGSYDPLPAFGTGKEHVCAFARTLDGRSVVTIVPRLVCGLTHGKEVLPCGMEFWQDSILPIPGARAGQNFSNVFTGRMCPITEHSGVPALDISAALGSFPIALLEPTDPG